MTASLLLAGFVAALAVAGLIGARQVLSVGLLSPVALAPLVYIIFGLVAAFLYPRVAGAPVGGGITLALPQDVTRSTATLFFVAATCMAISGLIIVRFVPGQRLTGRLDPPSTMVRNLLIVVPLLVLGMLVFGETPSALIERPDYIASNLASARLLGLGSALAAPAALALGYLFVASRNTIRFLAIVIAVLFEAVQFCLGSRQMAVLPVLFVLGTYLSGKQSRTKLLALLLACVAAVWLVHLALVLRSQDDHGLIPYVDALRHPGNSDIPYSATGRNLLIPFAITGESAYGVPHFPFHDFLVSINPLPGGMAGWYNIAEAHRLNYFTPDSAIGELGNYGMSVVVFYSLSVGAVLGYFDRRITHLASSGYRAVSMVFVALAAASTLTALEYNLRTSTRFLYYGLALDLAIRLALRLINRSRTSEPARLRRRQIVQI